MAVCACMYIAIAVCTAAIYFIIEYSHVQLSVLVEEQFKSICWEF